jgi:hypothetical protein
LAIWSPVKVGMPKDFATALSSVGVLPSNIFLLIMQRYKLFE